MSLRFPYRQFPTIRPVVALAGRMQRPRPIIAVAIIGPAGTVSLDAMIDTGAGDTVFPEHVAASIGVDLMNAPVGMSSGVATRVVSVRYAEVMLRIADSHEQREWKTWVGFIPGSFRRPLLGFAGFLQYFTATFHGDREEVELAINGLYPGT
ncbi:MAG TPA: hypothetical protein VNK04_04255 [Gemmataceae bacterium]|nr:hypothetical protein [Gemmataceae bacterium]